MVIYFYIINNNIKYYLLLKTNYLYNLVLFIYARGSAAVLLPGATHGRVKLFLSGNSTAGEAGVPLPASPAVEFPAKKLNPECVAEGSKTKVETPSDGKWGGGADGSVR